MTIATFTINGTDYMSYVDITEINEYYGLDDQHVIYVLTEDEKKVLAIAATRRIDLLHYKGCKSDEAQFTKWPRDPYGMPYDIELATILLMNLIHTDIAFGKVGANNPNIQRIRAGSVEVYYFKPSDVDLLGEALSITDPTVRSLLESYITTSETIKQESTSAGVAYGTGGVSLFKDFPNRYNRGYT